MRFCHISEKKCCFLDINQFVNIFSLTFVCIYFVVVCCCLLLFFCYISTALWPNLTAQHDFFLAHEIALKLTYAHNRLRIVQNHLNLITIPSDRLNAVVCPHKCVYGHLSVLVWYWLCICVC